MAEAIGHFQIYPDNGLFFFVPPKFLHKYCFHFVLFCLNSHEKIENNAYMQNFGGTKRSIMVKSGAHHPE